MTIDEKQVLTLFSQGLSISSICKLKFASVPRKETKSFVYGVLYADYMNNIFLKADVTVK